LNIWKADKLFFQFFENIFERKISLFVSPTFPRLLNFPKPDKLFFQFF